MNAPSWIERLEAGMLALGLNQTDLAEKVAVSRQFFSQVKGGERPGKKHVPNIARELNCTVEWLLNGTGEPPTWASVEAKSRVESSGTAYMAAVVPTPIERMILDRLANIEQLLIARLPERTHDETIRAGLAVSDPPDRSGKSGLVPQSTQ